MNFIEKNTKKVALVLGIATALSAVTTVYAASNTDGWHDGVYMVDGKVKTFDKGIGAATNAEIVYNLALLF